jgi:hypothetical protein
MIRDFVQSTKASVLRLLIGATLGRTRNLLIHVSSSCTSGSSLSTASLSNGRTLSSYELLY